LKELSVLDQLEKWLRLNINRECTVSSFGDRGMYLSITEGLGADYDAAGPTILDCLQDKTIQEVINP
jgi:hypothetical protein